MWPVSFNGEMILKDRAIITVRPETFMTRCKQFCDTKILLIQYMDRRVSQLAFLLLSATSHEFRKDCNTF